MKKILLCASLFTLHFFCLSNTKKIFFIIGPSGSGKTTVAGHIKNLHSNTIAHYSVGQLLREEALKDTSDAKIIRDFLSQAKIVPIPLNISVIEKAILNEEKSIILVDLHPTLEYLVAFEQFVSKHSHIKIRGAIEIIVEQDEAEKRVLGRQRSDDAKDQFSQRYNRYFEHRYQLIEHFKKKYHFVSLDGNASIIKLLKNIEPLVI